MKVNLPEEVGRKIRNHLDANGLSTIDSTYVFDRNTVFSSEELDSITGINLKNADIRYLGYFHNLSTLVIDHFPSINDSILTTIIETCPGLKALVIKNQSDLTKVDVSKLTNLRCLSLISNHNLVSVSGIDDLESFNNLEFYDNKSFKDVEYLFANLFEGDRHFSKVKLDLLYYPNVTSYLLSLPDEDYDKKVEYMEENIIWAEMYGFREPKSRYSSTGEVQDCYEKVTDITSEVVDRALPDEENFVRLYVWMVNNVRIPFNTLNKNYNPSDGTCKGIKSLETTPSFAPRMLQFMLKSINIDSEVVDVYTPLESVRKIGAVASDYAVLRTKFGEYSFSNIAMDIINTEFICKPSYANLFVDYSDVNKSNKIIHCSTFDKSVAMPKDQKGKLIASALDTKLINNERETNFEMDSLASVINQEVERSKISNYITLMQSNSITLSDYLVLKKKLAEARRSLNKYSMLGSNAKALSEDYGLMDVYESKSYIESALGISIDIFDKSGRKQGMDVFPLKDMNQLAAEKDGLIKQINREEQIGVLSRTSANKLKSKIEYVYGYFMRKIPVTKLDYEDYLAKFTDQVLAMLASDSIASGLKK